MDLDAVANDANLLEIGRKAVEDALIEWRDDRLSMPTRGNGLVICEKDGWRIKPLAKDWTPMNLDRVFKIDVCADGIVTVRGPGEPRRNDAALPVHSCDTREDAKALMILVCKLTYDGQYLLPPEIFDRKLSQAEAVKLLPDVGALFLRMEQVVEAKKAK